MRPINFKYPLIILILLFFSLLTACAKPSQNVINEKREEKVKLRCAIPLEYNTKLNASKSFETDIKKQFPNYDITFKFIKGDKKSYETKIKVLLSAKDKPDIFFAKGNDFFHELFSVKAIKPIGKYLDELKFWHMVLPYAKIDGYKGQIYAVPFEEANYQIIEINKDLFTKNNIKPPTNFEELKNAASLFKSKGIIPIAIGGKDGKTVYNIVESFACTIDSQVTENIMNGKEKFSDETFKTAAFKVKELMDMGAFGDNPKSLADSDGASLFYSGKAAMYCTSTLNFNISNKKLNGKCELISFPPIGNAKENDSISLVSNLQKNSGLVVSQASQHPKEAVKVAIEISNYYNRYLYEKENNVSTIYIPEKQEWKLSNNENIPLQKFMKDLSQNKNVSRSLLEDNINTKASKEIIEVSSAFVTGLLSVDSFTKELDKALKLK